MFGFGPIRLWVDCSDGLAATEVWLEARTDDLAAAARHPEQQGVRRCDAVEEFPSGFPGFWIKSPGGQVHLICAEQSP